MLYNSLTDFSKNFLQIYKILAGDIDFFSELKIFSFSQGLKITCQRKENDEKIYPNDI